MIAARAVAVNTAPVGIPSSIAKIEGLTARIYDIVMKVVMPAKISVRRENFEESKPKSLLNIAI